MPNTASARKRVRQAVRRNERNRARRSRVATFVKKVEIEIAAGNYEQAKEAFSLAEPVLMRSTTGGRVMHKNAASRKISRLSARVKALSASA
jgi:small subunit ribosomal protein S20